MPDFNPSATRVRFGHEAVVGDGAPATWRTARMLSETLGTELPLIQDESLNPNAEREAGDPTKITPDGAMNVNWSPEEHGAFVANFFGAAATPVESPTGVYTHLFQLSETDIEVPRTLAVEVDRDDGRPTLYTGGEAQQLTFAVSPRGYLNGAITLWPRRLQFWGTPTQTLGSSGIPLVRGYPKYALLSADTTADGDIYIEVSNAAPGDGSDFHVNVKVGAAGTHGGAAIPIFLNQWSELPTHWTGAADEDLGGEGIAVEVFFPTGFVAIATDAWRVNRERPAIVSALPTAAPLNEISTTILVDGVEFGLDQTTWTLTAPRVRREHIGGRFVDDIQLRGFFGCEVVIVREQLDRSLQDRILRAQTVALRQDAVGSLIGATGVRRRISLIALDCRPSGRTASAAGPDSLPENITLTAHPNADGTYPSAVAVEIVNSTADLTS